MRRAKLLHCGQPKRFPASKFSFKTSRRRSPSNRHRSPSFELQKPPQNNTSGVIGPVPPPSQGFTRPAMRPLFVANRALKGLIKKNHARSPIYDSGGHFVLLLKNA
jgi:hypothetical protein